MLRFYKFTEDIPAPVAARPTYLKRDRGNSRREPGGGWPEECPPIRAVNAFGWDLLAPFDLSFTRQESGDWKVEDPVEIESDWVYTPIDAEEGVEGAPLVQKNAWLWDEKQELPHAIAPSTFEAIRNQVKVSTFLFLGTDEHELLYMSDIPNLSRPFRAFSALLDTDWYPSSYPWHCVLELNPDHDEIRIPAGEPLCRVFTVRRDQYFAREMSPADFHDHFERSQRWLERYGKGAKEGMVDIQGNYGQQQRLSNFSVIL